MVHILAKNYIKYNGHEVEPEHIFFSDSGETGKSYFVKVIYNNISKTVPYYCKDHEKPRVLRYSIGGTTIHSGLAIKPRTTLFGLNDKSETDIKLLIIDELFMVSSDLWKGIDLRLGQIFMMIPEKAFAGLSVMIVADFLQLPPVRRKLIFSQFSDKDSMKNLLGLQLWHSFKYPELTQLVRQIDKLFIDLLNKVWVGNIDDEVENSLKPRFMRESEENCPKDALHMDVENEPAVSCLVKFTS